MQRVERGNILVTGGAGYIGSHVCRRLHSEGYNPVTFDNLSTGHAWAVKWGPLIHGDIRHGADIDDAFRRFSFQAVVHLAGDISVGDSVTDPDRHYRNNVLGTIEVLSALRRWRVANLVFSSTCTVYGVPQTALINESHSLSPVSPYGQSKLMCEQLIADFAAAYGLKACSLRLFNAAGAEADAGIGEARKVETHLIPKALDKVLGRAEFAIHGDNYATSDGTCVRDYIHVSDIAAAVYDSLRYLDSAHIGQGLLPLNISRGDGISVKQVLDAVETVTGADMTCPVHGVREGDAPILVGDNTRAAETIGWQPERLRLEDIVRSAWQWRMQTEQRRSA